MIRLDRESLLVQVEAAERFAKVEAHLRERGLTLDAEAFDGTIGAWLESGAPGARSAWLDPADHLLAGFSARIRSTSSVVFAIRPAPRRATGPDLAALVLGLRGRLLALEAVWLRVHRVAAARPTTEKFSGEEDEALGEDERALFDAIAEALK